MKHQVRKPGSRDAEVGDDFDEEHYENQISEDDLEAERMFSDVPGSYGIPLDDDEA
jgi:hypothetical protein